MTAAILGLTLAAIAATWLGAWFYFVLDARRALGRLGRRHTLTGRRDRWEGEVRGCRVTLGRAPNPREVVVRVVPSAALCPGLEIRPRDPRDPDPDRGRVRPSIRRLDAARALLATGHPELDDAVAISAAMSAAAAALAALGFETRDRLFQAAQLGLRIEDGALEARFDCGARTRVDPSVDLLVDLAEGLTAPADPLAALREIATRDPIPTVARAALELLVAEGHADPDWLAAVAADPTAHGQARFVAARALPDPLGQERLGSLAAQGGRWGALAAAVLAGAPSEVAPAEVLEGWLLAGLGAADPPVIDALGRIGTLRAVPALREAGHRHPEVRREVERALTAILSRVGASEGQVSMVDPVGGQLSQADAVGGELALRQPGER